MNMYILVCIYVYNNGQGKVKALYLLGLLLFLLMVNVLPAVPRHDDLKLFTHI